MKCREYEARRGLERHNADLIDSTALAGDPDARGGATDCELIGARRNVRPVAKSDSFGRRSDCRFLDAGPIAPAGGSGQDPSQLIKQSLFRICHSRTDLFEQCVAV